MNDVEILEKFKDDYLNIHEADIEGINVGHAIENILKERQEDKERIKELEKYEKYYQNERNLLDSYISKSKVKEAIDNGISDTKGWGCEEGAYCVKKEFERMGILGDSPNCKCESKEDCKYYEEGDDK